MSDPNTPDNAGDTAPVKSSAKNSQPSILNIKTVPTNSEMRIESSVLETLTFSQSEAVWELAPQGFLHPNSSIVIGFDVNATVSRAFPYPNVGIHSLIRRAVLRTTAGRVINDTDDWNSLQAIRSMYVHNSTNKEREQYLSGRQMSYGVSYDDKSDVTSTEGILLDNGMEQNVIAGDQQGVSVQPVLLNQNQAEFSVKLHDLFNYCKAGNQLPLYLLPNERVQIVLYWANGDNQSDRFAIAKSDDGNTSSAFVINRNRCKFIADYTFYDGEIMDKLREEYSQGLTFSYTDYRLSKQSVNQAGALNNVRNIGGNGNVVKSVLWSMADESKDDRNLVGPFNMSAPSGLGGAGNHEVNLLTSNLFINSEFLYPQSVTNPARQFHNLKEADGMIPHVPRPLYSGQGGISLNNAARDEFEGRGLSTELGSQFFGQGFRTSGLGTRIDNRGIDLHSSATMNAVTYTQRAWLEIERYVVISDGHLECYFV